MSSIANCPRCNQQVALPASANLDALVQCPVCNEEFPLGRVVDQSLPQAILVDPPSVLEVGPADSSSAPPPISAAPTRELEAGAADSTASFKVDRVELLPEQPAAESTPESLDANGTLFNQPAFETNAPPALSPDLNDMPTMAPLTRRRKSNPLRHLIGIVGGGVLGLAAGYLIVLWVRGPSGDFLKVGGQLPPWMVPASFNAPEEPEKELTLDERLAKLPKLPRNTEAPDDQLSEPTNPDNEPGNQEASSPSDNLDEESSPSSAAGDSPDSEAELPAEHQPPVAEKPGLRNPPQRTAEDLDSALRQAYRVRKDFESEKLGKRQVAAYLRFCRLGETFCAFRAEDDELNPEVQLRKRYRATKRILRQALTPGPVTQNLQKLSALWYHKKDRPENGVLLVGTVVNSIDHGTFVESKLRLDKQTVVSIFSYNRPGWQEHELGIVLGTIVDRPNEHLAGYTGSPQKVVWGALLFTR